MSSNNKKQKIFENDKKILSFSNIDFDIFKKIIPIGDIEIYPLSSLYYSKSIQGTMIISSNLIEIIGSYFDSEFGNCIKTFKLIIPILNDKIHGLMLEFIGTDTLYQRYFDNGLETSNLNIENGNIGLYSTEYSIDINYSTKYNIHSKKVEDILIYEPLLHPNVNWNDKIKRVIQISQN